MKITDIKTFLVDASAPSAWATRNWRFVKVETDEGHLRAGRGEWVAARHSDGTVIVRRRRR